MRPSLSTTNTTRVLAVVIATLLRAAHAADTPADAPANTPADKPANRGNDPFLHVSSAIVACPTPSGPVQTEQEWLADAHYRIERGNSCWIAGRCRLPNSYGYDKEIAENVTRRLNALNASLHWREKTSLWLTLQRRFIYIDGCVSPDFDKTRFVSELGETADVEKIIDRTTVLSPKLKARP